MESSIRVVPVSKTRFRTGLVFSGLAVLFLLFDSVIKLMQTTAVADAMGPLGYSLDLAFAIGIIEIVCLILYVLPRTAVLGAVLLTGYLGGAVATHLRVGNPLFTHILFPVYIGLLLWGGLYLRDARLAGLIPLRGPALRAP